jgi:hypothetical protein
MSRSEVAELAVHRQLDAELLTDEAGHIASGDSEGVGLVVFSPRATIDGDELYEVHEL